MYVQLNSLFGVHTSLGFDKCNHLLCNHHHSSYKEHSI